MGAALAALIVLGGCADTSGSTSADDPTATPTTAGSTDVAPGHVVRLSEHDKGSTVQVDPGDHVVVLLHNTYWRIGSPDGGALIQVGSQQDSPSPAGTCL